MKQMNLLKRKNGFYYIQYFDEDKSTIRRISTGYKKKSDALLYLANFKSTSRKIKQTKSITLEKFKTEYINHMSKTHSNSYVNSIKLSFNKLNEFIFNEILISEISYKIAQDFCSATFSRTKRGAMMYFKTLKAAFSRAVDWKYIESNPFEKIKLPNIEKATPLFITEAELNSIVAATPKVTLQRLFRFAFHTGMRLNEIIHIKWSDINFENKLITITNKIDFTTKSKNERVVPINNKLEAMLSSMHEDNISNDYVFKKFNDIKLNPQCVSKDFKKAVRQAGLNDKIHFHSLRHSFASNLVQKGASLYIVKELLGHENISTTQIYSHLRSEDLYNTIRLLD